MGVADRSQLHAFLIDEIGRIVLLEPTIVHRLFGKRGAWIWRGQRHLNGMRIDLLGEINGLLDGRARLAGQTENERTVNDDAELAAVLREAPCDIGTQSL